MSVPITVSCFWVLFFFFLEIVIGHRLFASVIRPGLFTFAFSSKSQKCLDSSKVTEIRNPNMSTI